MVRKKRFYVSLCLLLFVSSISLVLAQDQWSSLYYYSDSNQSAYVKYAGDNMIETARTYLWKDSFESFYSGKVRIKDLEINSYESQAAREWTSPRLAIINPDNEMERYELRFYPEQNKLQVNYVDRTLRTGNWSLDKDLTISDVITTTDCKINPKVWYYTVVTKNEDSWRAIVMSPKYPTCIVEWEDDRIQSQEYRVGVQSAGKYIVSQFQKLVGN